MSFKYGTIKIYHAEIWQDGMMVASAEGADRDFVESEINHYAAIYSQDGEVEIKWIGHDPREG